MTTPEIITILATGLFLVGCTAQTNTPPSPDQTAFDTAAAVGWKEVLFDSFTEDWQKQWTLDGEVATAVNTPDGIELTAGPERIDGHHMVLWTKEQFEGDVKIEYEFTRLDSESAGVNILYVQATGSGEGEYKTDIAEWAELRREPAMKLYYDCMNTYHISYAVGEPSNGYIRARRYMPHATGLKGSNLKPDYFPKGMFATGVPHKITVIKKERDLFMKCENAEQTVYCHMTNPDLPPITEGRIGLRLMWTRASNIKNFRISTPERGFTAEL
jgi:hypothetical protein